MATENYTTYDETDPGSDLAVAASAITVTALPGNVESHIVDSKGAGHFGDFEHWVKMTATTMSDNGAWITYHGVADANIYAFQDMFDNNKGIATYINKTGGNVQWRTYDTTNDQWDGSAEGLVTRYVIVKRVGTTFTTKLYTDTWEGNLSDTHTLTCGADTYEYIVACASHEGTDAGDLATGSIELLDLKEVVGWTGKIMGVTNPAKIMGVAVSSISKVMGVS